MKIKTNIIIEILGSPKHHVEETMSMLVERIKERKNITIVNYKTFEAQEVEKKPFWTTFTEAVIEFDNMEELIGFCFDFMPSSVEIIEPKKIDLDLNVATNIVNDLLARLHKYDMVLKNAHAENILLKKKIEKTS